MEILPILSYKQIKNITVDTTNIKLGTDPFTIHFKISPYASNIKNLT